MHSRPVCASHGLWCVSVQAAVKSPPPSMLHARPACWQTPAVQLSSSPALQQRHFHRHCTALHTSAVLTQAIFQWILANLMHLFFWSYQNFYADNRKGVSSNNHKYSRDLEQTQKWLYKQNSGFTNELINQLLISGTEQTITIQNLYSAMLLWLQRHWRTGQLRSIGGGEQMCFKSRFK